MKTWSGETIGSAEAERIIGEAAGAVDLPTERVPLAEAAGRVLREPVVADRPLPPYDRVMMDGIAVPAAAVDGAPGGGVDGLVFTVQGVQLPGREPLGPPSAGACFEVMTGAALPIGCGCIVPYEAVEVEDAQARVAAGTELVPGRYIHRAGSDTEAGVELVGPGVRLGGVELAVAASCGVAEVAVTRLPRVAVVSTGDELVEVGGAVSPYQIRRSNAYALPASIGDRARVEAHHFRDDPGLLREGLGRVLEEADALVLTGGVSKGKTDFVPGVLAELGVEPAFHGVRQRPGKPFWFGVRCGGRGGDSTVSPGPPRPLVFALPGNPVSALVGGVRYVLPALELMAGARPRRIERVRLAEDFVFDPPLTCFLPVARVPAGRGDGGDAGDGGLPEVRPQATKNSGDFVALVGSEGFVELPGEEQSRFPVGYVARFFGWG